MTARPEGGPAAAQLLGLGGSNPAGGMDICLL